MGAVSLNNITRERIIATAREWIGTPYKHQHSFKGLGADCLGLLRGVYEELYNTKIQGIPSYSTSWDEVKKEEDMLTQAKSYLVQKELYLPGDVLIFRIKPFFVAKHCAIVSYEDKIIHSYQGHGVVEVFMSSWWERKIAGIFEFPGVI